MSRRPAEWRALALLRAELDALPSAVELAIGDDCAVLPPRKSRTVWTTDACLEGVHFRADWLSPADLAFKALHPAVSDVCAMGARPLGALCHVTLGPRTTEAELRSFARGQKQAALAAECPIVGGNLAYGADFQVVTTVLGTFDSARQRPLLRSGARVGDEIWLIGEVGWAGLGLLLLERKEKRRLLAQRGAARALRAFRRPRARVVEGPQLLGRARSCIDVSDGLAGDAGHLAKASGVRLVLDGQALVEGSGPAFRELCAALGRPVLDAALLGGEDYALLATGPRAKRPAFARVIGSVEAGKGVFVTDGAARRSVADGGFEHRGR